MAAIAAGGTYSFVPEPDEDDSVLPDEDDLLLVGDDANVGETFPAAIRGATIADEVVDDEPTAAKPKARPRAKKAVDVAADADQALDDAPEATGSASGGLAPTASGVAAEPRPESGAAGGSKAVEDEAGSKAVEDQAGSRDDAPVAAAS
jgi:hypothetical protein